MSDGKRISHASVAISKWMNKFKFIVENTGAHQQVVATITQPIEEFSHKIRYTLGRRSKMHTSHLRKWHL